jgi:secreted Zn-dependent insulinase-like peptidase
MSDFENEEFESFDIEESNYFNIPNEKKRKIFKKFKFYSYILISPLLIIILFLYIFKITYSPNINLKTRNNVTILLEENKIKKPLTDSRNIEIISLKNGIECVLISDENSKRAGFSLIVNIEGKYSLIAYLTQLILYKNTPLGNVFQENVKLNYGNKKIITKEGLSTYYFDVDNNGLEKTMISLYNMIYNCPYLNKNLTPEEKFILAFDVETLKRIFDENKVFYDENLENEDSTFLEIADSLFFPKKNIQYNYDNIVNLLKSSYLNPKNIKISIISKRPLNEMEILLSKWSNINNNELNKENIFNPYTGINNKDKYGKYIITQNKNNENLFYFILICTKDNIYEINSMSYYEFISYIINYNGENSLSKILVKKKLIYNFKSQIIKTSLFSPNYLVIKMYITEEGIKSKNLIVNYVYKYLNFMNNNFDFSIPFKDFKTINNQKFLFLTIDKYENYLNSLSKRLFYFENNKKKLSNLLFGLYNIDEYNSKLMKNILSSLTDYNYVSIIINSPTINFNQIEFIRDKYKGIAFYYKKLIDKEIINSIQGNLKEHFQLRNKNKYISDINYIEEVSGNKDEILNEINYYKPIKYPNKSQKDSNINLFYRKDRTFKVPRIETYININFIRSDSTVNIKKIQEEQIFFFGIITNYIKFKLIEIEECGNSIKFEFLRNEGFNIKISSYKDKTSIIINEVLDILKNDLNQLILNQSKIETNLNFNSINEKYYDYLRSYGLLEGFNIQKNNQVDNKIVLDFIHNIINLSNINILLYGDLTENLVYNIYEKIQNTFKINKNFNNSMQKILKENFEKNTCFIYKYKVIFNEQDKNYLITTLKIGNKNIKNEIKADLIKLIWDSNKQYFNIEKIHYTDFIFLKITQTSDLSYPDQVREIITKYEIPSIKTSIKYLSDIDFELYIGKIKNNLNKKYLRLREKANKAFYEILSYSNFYFTKEDYLSEINNFNLEEFKLSTSEFFTSNLQIFFEFFKNDEQFIKKEDLEIENCSITYFNNI